MYLFIHKYVLKSTVDSWDYVFTSVCTHIYKSVVHYHINALQEAVDN